MKVRSDFVSNSSSTSFVVSAEDNAYGMLLHNPRLLTLKDYVDRYMYEDLDWYSECGLFISMGRVPKIEYVDDKDFIRMFLSGKYSNDKNTAPARVKPVLDRYLRAYKKSRDELGDSLGSDWAVPLLHTVCGEYFKELRRLVYECLSSDEKVKNMVFCVKAVDRDDPVPVYDREGGTEAEDDMLEQAYSDMTGGCDTIDQLICAKIHAYSMLKPLKFYRRFYE